MSQTIGFNFCFRLPMTTMSNLIFRRTTHPDLLSTAANPDNELAASADGQGDEAISGVKVEVAYYGIDQSLQNIFLTLRENGGAE